MCKLPFMNWAELLSSLQQGDIRALARCISLVENEYPGYEELLRELPASSKKIILYKTHPSDLDDHENYIILKNSFYFDLIIKQKNKER